MSATLFLFGSRTSRPCNAEGGTIGTMRHTIMKQVNRLKSLALAALLLLGLSTTAQAQYLRTSYFMEGSHYRMQLNPALTPGRGYINLPVIGSLNATVNSSTLGYQDILDIIDNSSDADYFLSQDFMDRLGNTNNLNVNLSTDILSAGWYKGKNFWSFNIGLRNDIGATIPKNVFEFMSRMNGLTTLDWANLNETLGGQKLEINSFAEVGLGFARDINEKLTIGGKVKALLGLGNMKLNVNNIDVQSHLEGIDLSNGYVDVENARGSASINVDATLESSSKLLELQQSTNSQGETYIDNIDFGSFGFAGYGAAIDLGVSYKLLKNLTLSASVLDLGFIKWDKSNTQIARAKAQQSYEASNPGEAMEFVDMVQSGEVLNFDMLQLSTDESAAKSRTSKLTTTVVVGAEYALLKNWLVLGALYTGRFAQPETLNELTVSANIRPANNFNLAVSYSLLQGAGKTFGAAIKLGPVFVGTDYMFFGKNTKNVNGYIGFSIPLNRQKKI